MANTLERRLFLLAAKPVKLRLKRADDDEEDDKDEKEDADPKDKEGADASDADQEEQEETEGDQEEPDEKNEDEEDDKDQRDGPGTLTGYAAVFHNDADPGTEYELWNDPSMRAVERIARGAFSRAVKEEDDTRALYNHDPNMILGRTSSGTCRLSEDEQGLRYDVDLPDTQTGRDVANLVDRGDVTGSSFGFVVEQESWRESEEENGRRVAVRTIESVRLLDVGPVTYPAYASTSAGRSASGTTVRAVGSVEEARSSYQKWKQQTTPLSAKIAAARARAVEVQSART